jgi:hypothetical protein
MDRQILVSKDELKQRLDDSLFHMTMIAEILNNCEEKIPSQIIEILRENLRDALFPQMEILVSSFDKSKIYKTTDIFLIVDKGKEGLDEVLYKYGFISEPLCMIKNCQRPEFAQRIFELSQQEMQDNRREIYKECEKFGNDKLAKQILELIEDVTLGTKPWSQFQKEVALILSPHLETSNA